MKPESYNQIIDILKRHHKKIIEEIDRALNKNTSKKDENADVFAELPSYRIQAENKVTVGDTGENIAYKLVLNFLTTEDENKKSQDSREYFRLVYLPGERPALKIGKHEFKVLDISQGGLRFLNDKKIRLKDWANGKLTLSCGEQLKVAGRVEWEHDSEFGLLLRDSLPAAIIEKERLFVFH